MLCLYLIPSLLLLGCLSSSVQSKPTQGCNGDVDGIPCCAHGFILGDNDNGVDEMFIQAGDYRLSCVNSCKSLYKNSIGITESVKQKYSSGNGKNKNKCWCEFGNVKLDVANQNYQTCVFSDVVNETMKVRELFAPYFRRGNLSTTSHNVELFHATSEENRRSILASGEFWLPSRDYAIENGLKLGAAAYFGFNPQYCLEEASNTDSNHGRRIVLVKVVADIGRCLDLGDYEEHEEDVEVWEWVTERITTEEANFFGFDSISINKNAEYRREIALYRPKEQILSMESFDM